MDIDKLDTQTQIKVSRPIENSAYYLPKNLYEKPDFYLVVQKVEKSFSFQLNHTG